MIESKSWFTYMVRCQNDAIYTGITNDLPARLKTHNSGKGSKSCRAHGLPVTLQCAIEQPNKSEALKLEARIKKLSKKHKEQFIDAYKQDLEDQKQQIQHPFPLTPIWSKSDIIQKTITEKMKEYRGLCLYMSTKITNELRMGG